LQPEAIQPSDPVIEEPATGDLTPKPRRSHDILPDPELDTGRGMRARLPPGSYRNLARGIVDDATVMHDAVFACNLKYDGVSDRGGENLWGGDTDENVSWTRCMH